MSMKLPVYAPRSRVVSPHGTPCGGSARKLTVPLLGAVQRYHAENAVVVGPGRLGSFGSRVKFELLPPILPLLPRISRANAKLSLVNEPVFQVKTVRPVSPENPSIAIWYVVPLVALNSTYSGTAMELFTTSVRLVTLDPVYTASTVGK